MQSDRLYQLKDLLASRPGISLAELGAALEASPATIKRGIEALRDRFDMPIEYDRFERGYFIRGRHDEKAAGRAPKTAELPGLWFNAEEALALLTLQQVLAQTEPQLFGPRLKPLQDKLARLLESGGHGAQAVQQRIRVLHAGKRRSNSNTFQIVAKATLARRRLRLHHLNRERGDQQTREVSPQQLVHYRDNWYLDAWCHLRNGLRSFSVDAMSDCVMLATPAQEVPPEVIRETLAGGYGIFGGRPTDTARLKFTPERARWVMHEQWHSEQKGWLEADGSYVLEVPYSDPRELIGDVLRFGDGVVVLGPKSLRERVHQALLKGAMGYVV